MELEPAAAAVTQGTPGQIHPVGVLPSLIPYRMLGLSD